MSSYEAVEMRMKRRIPRGREYLGRGLREIRGEEEEEDGRRRKRRRKGEERTGEGEGEGAEAGGVVE
jgi:hypothetical protein